MNPDRSVPKVRRSILVKAAPERLWQAFTSKARTEHSFEILDKVLHGGRALSTRCNRGRALQNFAGCEPGRIAEA